MPLFQLLESEFDFLRANMATRIKQRPLRILTVLAFALVLCGAFPLSAQADYLDFSLNLRTLAPVFPMLAERPRSSAPT
jgi:hypothetical protein